MTASAQTQSRFRRRASAPYSNITGYFVLGSLALMVLLAMILPNGPTIIEQVAAKGQQATVQGVVIMPTSTPASNGLSPVPALQLAVATPTEAFVPPTPWPTPPVVPAESVPAQIVQDTPETIVVPVDPVIVQITSAPIIVQDTPVVVQQPVNPIVNKAAPVVIQDTAVVVHNPATPEVQTDLPGGAIMIQPAPTVNPADFKDPAPASCQLVGKLSCPGPDGQDQSSAPSKVQP